MEYLANLNLNLSIYITLDLCRDSVYDKLYDIFGFDGQKTFAA